MSYTIDQFSKITGISKLVLRTWENRYQYLSADRTNTNIRSYSDKLLVKALKTKFLIDSGYKISLITKKNDVEINHIIEDLRINSNESHMNDYYVNKLIVNSFSCVNVSAQYAGIAALDGPDDSINLMVEKFTERRDLIHKLLNELPGVECSLPGGAFYAFPKVIGTGMDGNEFARRCMHEAGVAIVPGTSFGKTAKDYVRFSFAASRDNITEALEKIKKMLA